MADAMEGTVDFVLVMRELFVRWLLPRLAALFAVLFVLVYGARRFFLTLCCARCCGGRDGHQVGEKVKAD